MSEETFRQYSGYDSLNLGAPPIREQWIIARARNGWVVNSTDGEIYVFTRVQPMLALIGKNLAHWDIDKDAPELPLGQSGLATDDTVDLGDGVRRNWDFGRQPGMQGLAPQPPSAERFGEDEQD